MELVTISTYQLLRPVEL